MSVPDISAVSGIPAAPRHRARARATSVAALLCSTVVLLATSRAAAPAPANTAPASDDPVRVLFLGNSYTNANALPNLVAQLAASAGRTVEVDWNTPGGNTLGAPQVNGSAHAFNATSLAKIATGGWDAVVLQDQSFVPTIDQALSAYSLPAVQSLAAAVAAANPDARVVLFMTWGREQGGGPFCTGNWCSPAFADFGAMQAHLADAYAQLAAAAGGQVCPVGLAWQRHLSAAQPTDLFASDGSHPALAGSYLAACTFYGRLFGASPVGLTFTAGLSPAVALALQRDAAATLAHHDCGTSVSFAGDHDLALTAGGGIGTLAHFRIGGPFGPASVAVLAVSALPASIPFAGSTLAIDPSALVVGPRFAAVPTAASAVGFDVAVPPDPALVGLEAYVQGAVLASGALVLSDALRWRPCP